MKQFKDGEWQYIDYVPLEQSISVWPVKTRYSEGMAWFDKYEMASLLGWEVRDIRQYLDEMEANGNMPKDEIAMFEDKTSGGRILNTKCYSASIFLHISEASEIEGNQHKLWVLSKSGLDTNHKYEKLVLSLMDKNEEVESKYKYCILDYLWYHGERVKEAGGRSDGYFVLLYYMIFSIIPVAVLSPRFLPVTIALVLIMALLCVLLLFSRQRRWAIKVHFGLNFKINNSKWTAINSNHGLFMTIHLLSWLVWWTLFATLLK